jgi:hypothetical protein
VSGALFGRTKISLVGALDEIISRNSSSLNSDAHTSAPALLTAPGPLNQSVLTSGDKNLIPPLGVSSSSVSLAQPQYAKKYMNDVRNIAALKMTEIYEWSLEKGLERTNSSSSTSSSAANSIVSMFGIGKSGSSSGVGVLETLVPLARPSSDSVLKSRTYLCSYKFRYAIFLSDLGLTDAALAYALDVRNFIQHINQRVSSASSSASAASKPPSSAPLSGGGGGNVAKQPECPPTPMKPQPFSKGFMNTVNEFIDRLSGGNGNGNAGASGGSGNQKNSAGNSGAGGGAASGWNVWNMLNLKDLVDGPSTDSQAPPPQQLQPPSTSQRAGGPPMTQKGSGPPPTQGNNAMSSSTSAGPPPSQRPPPTQQNLAPPMPSSHFASAPPTSFPPQNQPSHGAPPLMPPGPPSAYPPTSQHQYQPEPLLRSSNSTGNLREEYGFPPSMSDNSLSGVNASHSNPSSHSGGAPPTSAAHPQHRKQHSADGSLSSLTKTSPTKPAGTVPKKSTEPEKSIMTSVCPPFFPLSPFSPISGPCLDL